MGKSGLCSVFRLFDWTKFLNIFFFRILELKSLLERLPAHSYETLKHLMRHLFRVSQNCHLNLMEPKNLAIIFGPSVVRTSNETLETVVKDMKHQCRIVEALVSHVRIFRIPFRFIVSNYIFCSTSTFLRMHHYRLWPRLQSTHQ